MYNKYIIRCSPLLITGEIQIRTTVEHHTIPMKVTMKNKSKTKTECNTYQWGCRELGTARGHANFAVSIKNTMKVLQKIKTGITI